MKSNGKEVKISFWAAHFTTIISVTLVLIIIGIIALISISAANETKRILEKLEVSVILKEDVSDQEASQLASEIAKQPYALQTSLITKQQALESWKQDTGEDLEALFGINPLSPEISFTLKSDYSSKENLHNLEANLAKLPQVEAVALPDDAMVESMNRNIERFAIILGIIAIVLIVISFVLINNTVHLAIYARRFTIHTMQLVGATPGFIMRPFIGSNMTAGIIAGFIASAIMAISLAAAPGAGYGYVKDYINWDIYAIVAGGVTVIGIILCGLAAWIATAHYLRKDYDDLFR